MNRYLGKSIIAENTINEIGNFVKTLNVQRTNFLTCSIQFIHSNKVHT